MLFRWDLLGFLAGIFFLFLIGLGVWVYFSAPGRKVNRWLGPSLVMEAFAGQAYSASRLFVEPGPRDALGDVLAIMGNIAYVFLFLGFMSVALETPLTRFLRSRFSQTLLVFLGVSMPFAAYIAGPILRWLDIVQWSTLVMITFSVIAAVDAFRRTSKGTLVRQRARAYLVAFGTRDVAIIAVILYQLYIGDPTVWMRSAFLGIVAVYIAVLLYGILKGQLFEIDVKARWTVHRGTVMGVFIAAFLIVAQLTENVLNQRLGWLWGGVAAGLLVFALGPILRLAERVSKAAVPSAKPLSNLDDQERDEFYEDHVRAAWEDGSIDRSDRALLNKLRERLGLSAAHAGEIELRITS